MKKSLITVLFAFATISHSAVYAVASPIYRAPLNQPVQVSVAVDGFVCQMCSDELRQDLAKLPGVTEVTATLTPAQVTARLNETKITVSQFVNVIAEHKTAMDANKSYYAHLLLYVDTKGCANEKEMCAKCKVEIPARLKSVKGVESVTLDASGKIASITMQSGSKITTHDLAKALEKSSLTFAFRFSDPAKATKDAHHQLSKGLPSCS